MHIPEASCLSGSWGFVSILHVPQAEPKLTCRTQDEHLRDTVRDASHGLSRESQVLDLSSVHIVWYMYML